MAGGGVALIGMTLIFGGGSPDGRHEEMRNKECCYTLRQMRIGYVKTKLCPLVIPSESPACRQKFFKSLFKIF